MNIFATHPDPEISARNHCDVHVIKMVTECAQLLSTAHIVIDGKQIAYKKTHENHPCALWVRESAANYKWAYEFYCSLLDEYEFRFDRMHASALHIFALSNVPSIPDIGLTPFAQAMPEEFRDANPCFAYRRYLRAKLCEWTAREKPVRTTFTRRKVPLFLNNVAHSENLPTVEPMSMRDLRFDLLDNNTL